MTSSIKAKLFKRGALSHDTGISMDSLIFLIMGLDDDYNTSTMLHAWFNDSTYAQSSEDPSLRRKFHIQWLSSILIDRDVMFT